LGFDLRYDGIHFILVNASCAGRCATKHPKNKDYSS
jgi:hypothetical protein